MAEYILGIDQSTQGTKALLFDQRGEILCRTDLPHKQMIDDNGWVEHDPKEIYDNTVQAVKDLVEKAEVAKEEIKAIGISNQRETALVWDRATGEPIYNAVVWQCARGAEICKEIEKDGHADMIRSRTGLKLSPYFSAAKISWILKNVPYAMERAQKGELCCGTVDSWLVYRLTGGKVFKTDYSNASRTQLFNIRTLSWDEEICGLFGIPICALGEVTDSDGDYGAADFDGFLKQKVSIRGVMGDSHGALFGQGCLSKGMIKATYGTGSSIMMNIGDTPIFSESVVTSLAWGMSGKINYVLEGNINYTGAVISWLKDDLQMISDPGETGELSEKANKQDTTYIVPAFTGLSAPYWDSEARAVIWGMSRTTKRAEIVKAGLESIGYQITDVIQAMSRESGIPIEELCADGGPAHNIYLMQFQSDMAGIPVKVPLAEELSGIGAAYAAGIAAGIYKKEDIFHGMERRIFLPSMKKEEREKKYNGWKTAVSHVLTK